MTSIGRYRIVKELGRGGMGVVYRAQGPDGREVALKAITSDDPQVKGRMQREIQTLCRLSHPGLVEIVDAGLHQGFPWLAMGLVPGESLEERLRRGPLPPEEVRSLGAQLAAALAYAHGEGVIHRDLKPANVQCHAGRFVLLDFGLTKDAEVQESIRLSQSGVTMGTPGYWSPEQAGGKPAGPPSDVHGLGATLFAALTGMAPYRGASIVNVIVATLNQQPERASLHAPVPEDLDDLILACLAKDPSERPRPEEVAARLAQPATEASAPGRRLGVLAAIGVAVLGLAIAGVLVRPRHQPRPTPSQAAATPEASATPSDPAATFALAARLDEGGDLETDLPRAVALYRIAAEGGHMESRMRYGVALARGHGTAQDPAEALKWFRGGGEDLGCRIFLGKTLLAKTPRPEILEVIRTLASTGDPEVCADLARAILEKKVAPADEGEAVRLLRRAAEEGNHDAENMLGVIAENAGRFSDARAYYERSAEAGNVEGMGNLGVLYVTGRGVERDFVRARELLERAAKSGNPRCMNELGLIFARGQGVPADPKRAAELFKAAAERGYVASMTHYAECLETGIGCPQDFVAARRWFRAAAEQGYVLAMGRLALLLHRGEGGPPDLAGAKRWAQKSAEAGDSFGMAQFSELLLKGVGGPKDPAGARRWARRAAEAGDVRGMHLLASVLYEHEPKDHPGARRWMQRAAEGGVAQAMAELAVILERGIGGPVDRAGAQRWRQRAREAGYRR